MAKDIRGQTFLPGCEPTKVKRSDRPTPTSLSPLEHRIWRFMVEDSGDWTEVELTRAMKLKPGQALGVVMRLLSWGLAESAGVRRVREQETHQMQMSYRGRQP